jgi:hypothetical protein
MTFSIGNSQMGIKASSGTTLRAAQASRALPLPGDEYDGRS